MIGNKNVLKNLVALMTTESKDFAKNSMEYTHNYYQCYIAARAVYGCNNRFAFTLGSGQGKTIVCLLIAAHYKKQGKKVTIVSPSKQLKM